MSKIAYQAPSSDTHAITADGIRIAIDDAVLEGYDLKLANTADWQSWAARQEVMTVVRERTAEIAPKAIEKSPQLTMSQKVARQAAERERERSDYIGSILALPEAQSRPIAAAKLASLYSDKSMPAAKASIFLRGLPEETGARITINEQEPSMSYAMPTNTDTATFKRKIELRFAALAQRANHGDMGAKADAKKLGYALKLIDTTNMNPIAALQSAGVEPATIR